MTSKQPPHQSATVDLEDDDSRPSVEVDQAMKPVSEPKPPKTAKQKKATAEAEKKKKKEEAEAAVAKKKKEQEAAAAAAKKKISTAAKPAAAKKPDTKKKAAAPKPADAEEEKQPDEDTPADAPATVAESDDEAEKEEEDSLVDYGYITEDRDFDPTNKTMNPHQVKFSGKPAMLTEQEEAKLNKNKAVVRDWAIMIGAKPWRKLDFEKDSHVFKKLIVAQSKPWSGDDSKANYTLNSRGGLNPMVFVSPVMVVGQESMYPAGFCKHDKRFEKKELKAPIFDKTCAPEYKMRLMAVSRDPFKNEYDPEALAFMEWDTRMCKEAFFGWYRADPKLMAERRTQCVANFRKFVEEASRRAAQLSKIKGGLTDELKDELALLERRAKKLSNKEISDLTADYIWTKYVRPTYECRILSLSGKKRGSGEGGATDGKNEGDASAVAQVDDGIPVPLSESILFRTKVAHWWEQPGRRYYKGPTFHPAIKALRAVRYVPKQKGEGDDKDAKPAEEAPVAGTLTSDSKGKGKRKKGQVNSLAMQWIPLYQQIGIKDPKTGKIIKRVEMRQLKNSDIKAGDHVAVAFQYTFSVGSFSGTQWGCQVRREPVAVFKYQSATARQLTIPEPEDDETREALKRIKEHGLIIDDDDADYVEIDENEAADITSRESAASSSADAGPGDGEPDTVVLPSGSERKEDDNDGEEEKGTGSQDDSDYAEQQRKRAKKSASAKKPDAKSAAAKAKSVQYRVDGEDEEKKEDEVEEDKEAMEAEEDE